MGLRKTRKNRSKKIRGGGWPVLYENPEKKAQREKNKEEVKKYIQNFINNKEHDKLLELYWKCKFRRYILTGGKEGDQTKNEIYILEHIMDYIYNKLRLSGRWVFSSTGRTDILGTSNVGVWNFAGVEKFHSGVLYANEKIEKLTTTVYSETIPNEKKDKEGNVVKENRLLWYLQSLEDPQFRDVAKVKWYTKLDVEPTELTNVNIAEEYDYFKRNMLIWYNNCRVKKYHDLPIYIKFRLIKKSFERKDNDNSLFKPPSINTEEKKFIRFEPLPTELLPTNGGSKRRKSGTKKKRRKTKRI